MTDFSTFEKTQRKPCSERCLILRKKSVLRELLLRQVPPARPRHPFRTICYHQWLRRHPNLKIAQLLQMKTSHGILGERKIRRGTKLGMQMKKFTLYVQPGDGEGHFHRGSHKLLIRKYSPRYCRRLVLQITKQSLGRLNQRFHAKRGIQKAC